MLLFWKGRGILTGFYLIGMMILMYLLISYLDSNVGGNFIEDNTMLFGMATAFIVAGLLTHRTSISHVVTNGEKRRIKVKHTFYFIPMIVWAVVFYVIGIFLVIGGVAILRS